jgi:hypothetical protein
MAYTGTRWNLQGLTTFTHDTIYSAIKQYYSTLHLPAKAPACSTAANQLALSQKTVENVA